MSDTKAKKLMEYVGENQIFIVPYFLLICKKFNGSENAVYSKARNALNEHNFILTLPKGAQNFFGRF